MNAKKLVLTIAIFGGMLFTAQATDLINLDEQATNFADRPSIKVPTKG